MRTGLAVTMLAFSAFCAAPVQMAHAQTPSSMWPRCIAERAGQQLSQAGSVCECGFDPGGLMNVRPSGWRWTCSILSPDSSSLSFSADNHPDQRLLPFGSGYSYDGGDPTRLLRGVSPLADPRGYSPYPTPPQPSPDGRLR